MTRQEMYESIYTHDTIYIPPHEEDYPGLEVALGCSWHKCRFCDFARDEFKIHPLDKIEYNVKTLGQLQPDTERLFLLGENPFVMDTDYLCQIIDLVEKYMPNVTRLSTYARVDDILRKSDEELALLRSRNLKALHIGVESGSDSILAMHKKGITADQTVKALKKLDKAGIDYYVTVVMGLGGRRLSKIHALETAAMLNQTNPVNIWCIKLILWKNTPLWQDAQNGIFDMMTPAEMLVEERLLIKNLNLTNCLFEDTTVLDKYTIQGNLPEQKQQLINAIDYLLTAAK